MRTAMLRTLWFLVVWGLFRRATDETEFWMTVFAASVWATDLSIVIVNSVREIASAAEQGAQP